MSRPARPAIPTTPAVLRLRAGAVPFVAHHYDYLEHGGTAEAARQLGHDEHAIIKTLVMHADREREFLVLMHGDRDVSTRSLGRSLGARQVQVVAPEDARRITGYHVGGISPFGTRRPLPVYVQQSILQLPAILINGGQRGFLVELDPAVLIRLLRASPVDCALTPS